MHIIYIGALLLISGRVLVLRRLNWLIIWVGLELNLFGALVLIKETNNQKSLESLVKYFIVQVFSSMFLLLCILSKRWRFIFFPLLIKISSVPFHFWFIPVLRGIEWRMVFILISWQKLAPLVLLFNLSISAYTLLVISCLNAVVGRLIGLFQVKLKAIVGYSSIYHIAWFLLLLKRLNYLCVIYLLVYSRLNFSIIKIFKVIKAESIFRVLTKGGSPVLILSFGIISLRGLPPFFGFFLKWFIITNLTLAFILGLFILLFFIYFKFVFLPSGCS